MKKILLAIICLLAAFITTMPSASAAERKPVKQLVEDFRKLEFGMFIHYNMATYHNAQWVQGYPDPSTFNPGGKVDTDAWADAAVKAGMTYAVLTAKHVAGFCLWDSKYTTYDIMHPDCPYKQDFVAQFIKSFKSRGLKVGLYYCWRHPGFDKGNKGKNNGLFKVVPPECDPATHTLAQQIEFQKKQIAELIEKYPDVFYIWNDALDDGVMTADQAKAFYSNQRQVLTSGNWWSWAKKGTPFMDVGVKETRHFKGYADVPRETCWKLEPGWFWQKGYKTANVKGIMSHMQKAYANNSNFLLNVGPDKNGKILPSSVKALEEIGTLLGTNNTKKQIPAVLPAPDNTPPVKNKPVKVYILAGQSNMVGIGQVSGGSSRWSNQFIDPIVSIYPGKYSATADYDRMTPIETKKLPSFGGTKPTPYPRGGTAVTRGFIKLKSDGVYEFNVGYGASSDSMMEIDGKEVYRKEAGKLPVRSGFKFTAGKKYPFKITYFNEHANGLGWLWRADLPGTLDTVVKADKKFPHLIDDKGNWTVRNDVWYKGVVTAAANKWLTIGCGAGATSIGPELQFGHIMGYYHDEPVIVLKASQGNRSLGWDFLPPGSKRYTAGEYTYAGYKDSPDRWLTGTEPKPINWYAGLQYDDCFKQAHDVLDNFDNNFPQWKGQGYEIAGFAWWQGHKDGGSDAHTSHYEQNLISLINNLRKEFNAPKAPFVIATIGFGGWKMSGNHKKIADAQLAVSGEKGKYPDFKGNVLTVETRDFWKEPDVSPRNQDFHYNGNAETYMMVGDAIGRGMVKLLSKSETKKTAPKFRAKRNVIHPDPIYKPGVKSSYYSTPWSENLDVDKLVPEKTKIINIASMRRRGNANSASSGDGFTRVKGLIKIDEKGKYKFRCGFGDSRFNVMTINGKEVSRKNIGDTETVVTAPAARTSRDRSRYTNNPYFLTKGATEISLTKGYHPFEIIFFKNVNPFFILQATSDSERFSSMRDKTLWHEVKFKKEIETKLLSTIAALKSHIKGETTLNAKQIETHKLVIDSHGVFFGQNDTIVKASFDLVEAYEKTKKPSWIARSGINRKTLVNDIRWTIFNVMQNIVDRTYTSKSITLYNNLIDGFKFKCADHFPGKVDPPANPNKIHSPIISASFPRTFGRLENGFSRKPTGTYLAPGTIATITVPKSLAGKGYNVRVGSHSWDFSRKPRIKRLDRISLVYSIDSTEVKVANPLGGGIYIEVPYLADGGIVDVKIKNAVRSPYFSMKSFHKTTLQEWKKIERNHKAPFADFQSEKFMMNVPTNWIYKLDDPITLMKNWDISMDAMNDLMGLPRIRGKETMYPQVDLMMKAAAYAPGYPSSNLRFDPERDFGGNASHHLIRGPQYASSYEFHEQGHGFLFVKFPGEVEAAVNIPHVAVWHQKFGYSLDDAFRMSRRMKNKFQTLDNTSVTWMTSENFAKKIPMTPLEKKYQLKGHAKFVEIARLFGWKTINDFYYSINVDFENGKEWSRHGSDIDKLLLRLSKSVGVDISPLFHFWGTPPVNADALKSAIAAEKLPASAKIYDTLVKYRSLAPANNKAFQEFAKDWWQKKPGIKGYVTENGHAKQWDKYDEKTSALIKQTVQEIIDTYFPNGRPGK